MDAIECGIVKLPRVPVADNIPGGDMPKYRNLWEHIGFAMPKKGRGRAGHLDPQPTGRTPDRLRGPVRALPENLRTLGASGDRGEALLHLGLQHTATSELVYKYISGFHRENDDGSRIFHNGRFELFRNFDE